MIVHFRTDSTHMACGELLTTMAWPLHHTSDTEKVTCQCCIAYLAKQVEAVLDAGEAKGWVETCVHALLVQHRKQLPSPAAFDDCLDKAMQVLGVEYQVLPTPPAQAGYLQGTVHYTVGHGEVKTLRIAVG